ncbi:MAG: sulfate reduction electron transfer complex DsrMKJOP subunit DsrJ, partial [Thermodesulfobacteriota bacterium]
MYDKGKVLTGLAIFVVLALSVVGYNMIAGDDKKPEPEKPAGYTDCVLPKEEMAKSHMVLLNQWRDEVVREGKREKVEAGDVMVEKSLQNGCMGCHTNKAKFCDRCHEYASVRPYCWDCHLEPVAAAEGQVAPADTADTA